MTTPRATDETRQDIRDTLTFRFARDTATLKDIGNRLRRHHSDEALGEALRDCIKDGSVLFEYSANLRANGGFHGLVFFAPHAERPALAPSQDISVLLDELLKELANRTDGRGDDWPQATFEELHRLLGKRYSADDIVLALRLGIKDDLLSCWARVEDNDRAQDYICFVMSPHRWQTVVAFAPANNQALCFHVRAGSPVAAVRKVQESAHSKPDLQVLAVLPGRHKMESAPGYGVLNIEEVR